MAIDYIIDYSCTPKQQIGTYSIMERLKGAERAETIIRLFRENGDERPPSEMGFEFTRNTPDGEEQTRIIVVQDLLDEAAALGPVAHHCQGCPANRSGQPFGCMGYIQYPISAAAEKWLLDNLPVPDETLVWMLLRQGIREFKYDGETVRPLRESGDLYFEDRLASSRRLGEFQIDGNQLFEMIFGVGNILPNHGALLLLFLNAIERDLEADVIMNITPAPADVESRHPFLMQYFDRDDTSVTDFKEFLQALHIAWKLDVKVLLDV